MDNDLSSILSEQDASDSGDAEQVSIEHEQSAAEQATGGEAASPAVEQEETEADKRYKGLEAATIAERRRRQQLEQENRTLAEQLQRFQQTQKTEPQARPTTEEPKRDDFQSDTDYYRALARHEAKLLRDQDKAEEATQAEQRKQQEQIEEVGKRLDAIVTKGRGKYRDFDAVINDGLAPFLNGLLQQALLESDQAEEVAYYLAKNPSEAARVTQLSKEKLLKAIGHIEAKLGESESEQSTLRAGPSTLTQARNATGQFQKAYGGPTPLDDILAPQR